VDATATDTPAVTVAVSASVSAVIARSTRPLHTRETERVVTGTPPRPPGRDRPATGGTG
jgi:hypothetical protein